jgi:hypothetical protein
MLPSGSAGHLPAGAPGWTLAGLVVAIVHGSPAADASFTNLVALDVPTSAGGSFPSGVLGSCSHPDRRLLIPRRRAARHGCSRDPGPAQGAPRRDQSVPIRIMLFYVGALAVLMSVTQAQRLRRAQPLVQALGSIGIPAAASIMNFVVITSALSSCSSGALFYNARLLMRMSRDGMATRRLGRVNQSHVPGHRRRHLERLHAARGGTQRDRAPAGVRLPARDLHSRRAVDLGRDRGHP